jgi:integrase
VRPNEIVLRAENTKTAQTRAVPIMSRMRALLDSRRKRPDGPEHAADRFVLGNEAGERITRVRRAWDNTCRRAKISDLNIYDLRREFGRGSWSRAPRASTTSATGSGTPMWRPRVST